ncbi:MAG: SLC26A/SulP transporter family protein [Rhodospirillales bacterium]|nr:SLC26A/SulP transporter family protein [Rhodospirillales bacterium]
MQTFRQWWRRDFKGDFIGAIASTLMSLPISMSVGVIAFAPLGKDYATQGVIAGIYGAIMLGFCSALFGGRSIMLSGPRAASGLVVASLMAQIIASDDLLFPPGQTVHFVVALTFFTIFLAGLIQFLAGATRIANIVKNIPHPVAAGFMNSAALIVITGQIWTLLDIPKGESLLDILPLLGDARPLTTFPGLVTVVAMILLRRWTPKIPSPVAGLLIGTATFYAMKVLMNGADVGPTLGEITSILPMAPGLDMFTSLAAAGDMLAVLLIVVPAAFSLAAMVSLESALTLSTLDEMSGRRTDSNRELVGHGIGNMAAALSGGLIGAGAMVRSKPGFDAGGRTPAMAFIKSMLMLMVVLALAHYIEYIPRAVIAAMILVIGFQNFDKWSFALVKRCLAGNFRKKAGPMLDLFIILLVMAVAVAFDLIVAVGVGVGVSIIVFVSRMSRSIIRRECHGPGIHARSMWNEERQAALEKCGHQIAVLDLEGAIFFGTAEGLESRIHKLVEEDVNHVVLDMKRIRDIDSTGALALVRINRYLKKKGGKLAISYVLKDRRFEPAEYGGQERRANRNTRSLWSIFMDSGALNDLGEEIFFPDTDRALAFCENHLLQAQAGGTTTAVRRAKSMPPILIGLAASDVKMIRRFFTRQSFKAGESIFQQGDTGDALFYISRGRADVVVRLHHTGQVKRLQSLTDGAVFGEMAILDNKPRAASIVAAEDTVCYRLSVGDFEKLKESKYEIALKLFANICAMLSGRIRAANTMVTELEN